MIYIGIVGSSKAHLLQVEYAINKILDEYNFMTTTLVSGGAEGVDEWANLLGKRRGFNVIEYKAKGVGWDYYRPRNLLIANKCDKVYSIALELIANGTKCYHCKKRGLDNNHFKTAGCWTAQRCKDYEIIVARGNSK